MRHPNDSAARESQLTAYDASLKSANNPADWRGHLRRWPIYAAAAGAALASATTAEAGNIVYGFSGKTIGVTGFHQSASTRVTLGTLGNLRLAIGFLTEDGYSLEDIAVKSDELLVHTFDGAAFRPMALNLPISAEIGPSRGLLGPPSHSRSGFAGAAQLFALGSPGNGFGSIGAGMTAIVGFFLGNFFGNAEYGWIQVRWEKGGGPFPAPSYPESLEALNWAVNTTPNQPILAGETPEPGTLPLTLLAAGYAGILAFRKARQC